MPRGPSTAPVPLVSPADSTGGPSTLAGSFGSVSCEATPPLLWGHKILFVPSKTEVSISPSPLEVL